jgi:hypothetical protein
VPIIVKFLLYFNPDSYSSIASKLKGLDLEVLSLEEYENRNPDPTSLICMRKYGDTDAIKVLETINGIFRIKEIEDTVPMPNVVTEKPVWYKHPLAPIGISTFLTLIVIVSTVRGLDVHLTGEDYFFLLSLPIASSFFSQILYRVYSPLRTFFQ